MEDGLVLCGLGNMVVFQIPALFMLGLVLGRTRKFEINPINIKFWRKILVISGVLGVVFLSGTKLIPDLITRDVLLNQVNIVIETWSNFIFTFVWISIFVLLYDTQWMYKLLSRLENIWKK